MQTSQLISQQLDIDFKLILAKHDRFFEYSLVNKLTQLKALLCGDCTVNVFNSKIVSSVFIVVKNEAFWLIRFEL